MASDPKDWHAKAERDYPDDWDPPVKEGQPAKPSEDDTNNMIAYKAGWESARRRAGD